MTLYTDLGLEPDATPEQIIAAHRAAVKRTHPDTGGDPDEFNKVQRAALVLRDPDKRQRYDQTGQTEDSPDNSLSEMTAFLTSAFDRAMAQEGWEYRDIIEQMRNILSTDIRGIEQQQAEGKRVKALAEKAHKRLRFKGKSRNILGMVLEDRVRQIDAQLLAMAAQVEKIKRARDLAADYDWTRDQRPNAMSPDMADAFAYAIRNSRHTTSTTGW